MKGCVRVSSNGGSGGLARFWREDINLQLVSCSKSHIDMIAEEDQGKNIGVLLGSIESLMHEKETSHGIYCGDWLNKVTKGGSFKEILWDHEKIVERLRRES